MEWLERLNIAIDYIEEHLTGEIDFDEVAKIALCSSYHFQRMFSYMAEMTISEYIRRRRMSRAAMDLSGGEKVIDVALKYRYESPTAFNRAFQGIHGISPSRLKNSQSSIKLFTPIRFAITIKGAQEMNVKLVKREAFRVEGIAQEISHDMEKNFATIPNMWDDAKRSGTIEKLCGYMTAQPQAVLGICFCDDSRQWKYAIAVASNDKTDDAFTEFTIPAAN